MSTRSIIARSTGPNTFAGRYHHSDGYPEGLGATLFDLYNGHFQRDGHKMLAFLVDAHPAGYSTINDCDLSLPAGRTDYEQRYEKGADGRADFSKPIPHGIQCHCHKNGKRLRVSEGKNEGAEPWLITEKDRPDDREWAYIISAQDHTMQVMKRVEDPAAPEDVGWSDRCKWLTVATVDLDGAEPNWKVVCCGEKLERAEMVGRLQQPLPARAPRSSPPPLSRTGRRGTNGR